MNRYVRVRNHVLEVRGTLRDGYVVLEVPAARFWHVRRSGDRALLVGDQAREVVWFVRDGRGNIWVAWRGHVFRMEPVLPRQERVASPSRPREITSPLTGRVQKVHVREGERVEEGAPLVTVEAMKMEYHLTAPALAEVEAVPVKEGDLVDLGQVLVRLSYPPADHFQREGE